MDYELDSRTGQPTGPTVGYRAEEGVASPLSFPPLESVTVGGNSYHRNERKLLIVVMKSPSV